MPANTQFNQRTLRSARGSGCENTYPNINAAKNGRRSPRLGSCSGSSINRPAYPQAGARGGALADITNVSTQADKVDKVRSLKPAPAAASAPAPAMPQEEVNAQSVQEYAADICKQLFRDETVLLARTDYMDTQTDITSKMRTILIDWLVEVHAKYRLCPETLHLTINLIDRYLSKKPITRTRLQLVGVVAMFIAAKFEEIHPPELHDWVYITDNAYKKEDLIVMECTMLATLNFQIVVPTAAHFFPVFEQANECDAVHRDTAQYLLELSLLDVRMLQYKPSHLVAAAFLLSNELLKRSQVWPASMEQQSNHTEEALQSCVGELRRLLEADRAGVGGQLQAVHKKFSAVQRHGVAKMDF